MRVILTVGLAAILAGCASHEDSPRTDSKDQPPPAADPEPRVAQHDPEPPPAAASGGNAAGDPGPGEQPLLGLPDVVAEMDGYKVTREEFLRRSVEWYGPDALEEIILRHVLDRAAADSGASYTQKELSTRVDEVLKQKEKEVQQKYKLTLAQYLEKLGRTVQQLRTEMEKNVDLQRQILLEYMLAYAYFTEPRVVIAHIVVRDEKRAKDLRQQILDGADFGKLAQTESDDSDSASKGGRLSEFFPGMTPLGEAFEDTAFGLQRPGEVSEVIHTEMGYHILRLIQRTPANPQTFENLREKILTTKNDTPALNAFMRRLRKQYVKGLKYAVPDLEPRKK